MRTLELPFRTAFIAVAISLMTLLTGCGVSLSSQEKKALQEQTARAVSQRLDERSYTIVVDYMTPLRGPGRAISSPYSLTVDGTTVDSYLPYVGVARNVPYGGGKVLTFKDEIEEYRDSGFSKDRRTIVFSTDNGEDLIVYTLTVFDNGKASVDVHCRNREDISYRGYLKTEAD